MTITVSRLRRALARLGMEYSTSGAHCSGYLVDDRGQRLFPAVSFPTKALELPPAVVVHLRRQLFLTSDQFDTLLRGEMSREEYLSLRRAAGGG